MYRILFILYFILLQTILIAQNISNDEAKADSLSKYKSYQEALLFYDKSIKSNSLNYIDSVRITLKEAKISYHLNDLILFKKKLKTIECIKNTHLDIKYNPHLASYIDFLNGIYQGEIFDYDSASYFIDNAINKRIKNFSDTILADLITYRGIIYSKKADYIKSIIYYNLAIKYYIKNKVFDNNIVRIILNKAYIYWLQNDFIKFKKINEIALKISTLFNIKDKYLSQILMNLGTYYLNQSDYFNAYKNYSKVEKLTNINNLVLLQSQYYLAYTSYILGDINLSSGYFKKMLYNYDLLDEYMQTDLNYYYSHTFLSACRFDSTIFYLDKCLISSKFSLNIKLEHILYAKAYTYTKMNNQDSALNYISLAIKKFENKNSPEYAKSIYLKGKILNNIESEKFYNEAKSLILKTNGVKHAKTSYLFKELGITRFENKKYRLALQEFQQALISVDLDFNSTNIFDNPKCEHIISAVNLAKALRYKSEALEQIYLQSDSIQYLEAAYETAKLLTEQIEKMLMSYPLFESKQFLMDNSANTFSRAQYLGYLCWKKTGKEKYKNENIVLSEKARATILKSQIQDNELTGNRLNDTASNTLIEIEQNIAYITGQINENTANKTVIDNLKNQLFELQEQKNKLTENLKGEYGNFSNYFKNTKAMSYKELINYPSENEAILEYTLNDSVLILNVVAKNQHEIFEITYDSILQNNLQKLKNIVAPENIAYLMISTQDEINELGKYLYNTLLKPSEIIIKGKQLLIVQEPKLGFIPFEAFVKENKYLIEYQPINYIYSINITNAVKQKTSDNYEIKMAAFLPGYDFDSNKVTLYSKNIYKTLSPLNYKEESERIYKITGCDTFLVNNATEEIFKKLAGNYTVLHLALHSVLNPENYIISKLCFTSVNDTLNDGIFNLCDVAPLKLNSQLTFLSGCSTGGGQIIEGEGVMSFARSFILAGSKSIIMSLWDLNNNSAIDLSSGFYKYLSDGYNKAEALQMSKIDYLKKSDNLHKHPFFWSGLVLIGDKENIKISKPFTALEKTAIALGILAIIFVIFIIAKKRKQIFNDYEQENNDDCGC